MTEEMQGSQKIQEDKKANRLILTRLSELEAKIKVACAEENYDLAG